MTSRPPPRTSITRSSCSVRTSRNSMSESWSRRQPASSLSPRPCPRILSWSFHPRLEDSHGRRRPHPSFPSLKSRIQFSSPLRLRGGPGMLSNTSLASRDLFTMTSFSRTAVCMRRTLDWFLQKREERK